MSCVYRYMVEDSGSSVYTHGQSLISDIKYDLHPDSGDRWRLVLAVAEDYFKRGGFRNRVWLSGKQSIRVSILLDGGTGYSYDVDCDDVPHYGSVNVLA